MNRPARANGAGPPAPSHTQLPGTLAERLDALELHRSVEVRARLEAARRLEREAALAGDTLGRMRARLVVADMLHRTGELAEGARLAAEVNGWAEAEGARRLLARSHLVLSSVFEGMGAGAAVLEHAVQAIDLLDDDVAARDRGNHLMRLADALAVVGSGDEARRRYNEAAAAFASVDDVERGLNVLNNRIVLECDLGAIEAAGDAARRLVELCGPDRMNPAYADTIARVRFIAGDLTGAEEMLETGFRLLTEQGDTQALTPAELAHTLAQVLLAQGRLDEAHVVVGRGLDVCHERSLAGVRVDMMAVQAAVFAAEGDFCRAYELHRALHAASVALRSEQQEAAAQARQALFATAEARREAQRFWRQARTDPLTELYNRRFVDESLPRYLAHVAGGATVLAAIIDIDHFKLINDLFSHAVGDQVLRRLAALLTDAAGGGIDLEDAGFAARLGGEEFLLVLTAANGAGAGPRVEQLRRRVETLDWSDIAPSLAVTVSAGVAVAQPDDTQLSLLTRADLHLYEAKQNGRNLVVADGIDGSEFNAVG